MAQLNSDDPFQKVAVICSHIQDILLQIYPNLYQVQEFSKLILKPETGLTGNSRVLFEEESSHQDFFLGIYFSSPVIDGCRSQTIPLDVLSVVAEETSHLLAVADAALGGGNTSLLSLEILGEIDRFLVFAHHFSAANQSPLNLMDIKDILFENRSLRATLLPEEISRYQEAEIAALAFLREAFKEHWHRSYIDWTTLKAQTQAPLGLLRQRLLGLGPIKLYA